MPQVRITPWRHAQELLGVRGMFYPSLCSSPSDADERREAVEIVHAWAIRGNLPHQVEATAALTAAMLQDEASSRMTHGEEGAVPYCVDFALSGALCLFVTRLVDPGRSGIYVRSMYKTAEQIGLPAIFVDVRHDATHGPAPSLPVLRRRVQEALAWLWERYWKGLDEGLGKVGGGR